METRAKCRSADGTTDEPGDSFSQAARLAGKSVGGASSAVIAKLPAFSRRQVLQPEVFDMNLKGAAQ